MAERILLTQLRRIGDVMMTTPAVAAVRAALPKADITYLTEHPADQLVRPSPHVDRVLTMPPKGTVAGQAGFERAQRLAPQQFVHGRNLPQQRFARDPALVQPVVN